MLKTYKNTLKKNKERSGDNFKSRGNQNSFSEKEMLEFQ